MYHIILGKLNLPNIIRPNLENQSGHKSDVNKLAVRNYVGGFEKTI